MSDLKDCSECLQSLPKTSFSHRQLKKAAASRRCAECASRATDVDAPRRSSERAPAGLGEEHTVGDVKVTTVPGLGRCLVAVKLIPAGTVFLKERPVITVKLEVDRASSTLRKFCASSAETQAKVLDMFSPMDEQTIPYLKLEGPVARLSREKWAEGHSRTILHKALLAFELNGIFFGTDSSALFELGSKLSHSCWSNSCFHVVEGHGCHMALRPIAEGEMVTTDYLGESYLYGFPLRQRLLFEQKAFRCRCARCLGVDRARSVPCPGCHPHGSDGFLSEEVLQPEATVSYAVAQAGGVDEWRCEGCGKVWSGDEMFPQHAPEGTRMEESLSKAVYEIDQELDVDVYSIDIEGSPSDNSSFF
eukprot:Selendium_serpulae@DN6506_c1_g1_i1.p1